MKLSAQETALVRAVVREGAQACASRLAEITYNPWSVDEVDSAESEEAFADLLAGVAADTYGSHLTFPGGSFLLLYSGKSAYLIATAFTRDFQDRVESLPKRDAHALGEVSNIMLNPMMGRLAKAAGAPLIISAPKTGIASRRDHFAQAVARYEDAGSFPVVVRVRLGSSQLHSQCLLLLLLDPATASAFAGGPKTPPA